ncbi:MAG: chemotaxis protein CheX [Deltaproteobacteria bacterium]|jgi:CheY-specific phosphatase CheX|nr:chemotaxis protein CheX [Deltaproteobacteria bacterium]
METSEIDLDSLTTQFENIIRAVFEPLLKAPLERVEELLPEDNQKATRSACVHILGGWQGTVSSEIEIDLLTTITKNMLQKEQVDADELGSVSSELTNIIGGNLKGILAVDRCILSIPKEKVSQGFDFHELENKIIIKLCFKSGFQLMVIKLHQALTKIV